MKLNSTLTGIVLVALGAALAACGEATPDPVEPTVTTAAASAVAPPVTAAPTVTATAAAVAPPALPNLNLQLGHIDARLMSQATTAKGVQKLKIHTGTAGDLTKLSLYHNDPSLVPDAVMATLKKKLPGATIKSYEAEFYADKGRVMEIEVTTKDKKECELGASPEGKYLYTECVIKADKLPKAVKDAVTKLLPGGEFVEVEQTTGLGEGFTVEVKKDGAVHEVELNPKGVVIWHGLRVATSFDVTVATGAAPAGDATKVGNVQPDLLGAALKAKGVEKMKFLIGPGGDVGKISLYHHDDMQVPDAAKATATSKFAGGKVKSFENEVYTDKGNAFEVDMTMADGKDCEVSSLKDGTYVYTECDIKKEELPKEVMDAVNKLAPGGEIIEAEKRESPYGNGYNVEVKKDGVVHYLKFGPTGELAWHGIRIKTELAITVP